MSGQYIYYPVVGGSGGVSSLNALTGALTLVAGSNITITPSGTNITISASGGGGLAIGNAISGSAGGTILFSTAGSKLGEDSTNLLWDNVGKALTLGGQFALNNAGQVVYTSNSADSITAGGSFSVTRLGTIATGFAISVNALLNTTGGSTAVALNAVPTSSASAIYAGRFQTINSSANSNTGTAYGIRVSAPSNIGGGSLNSYYGLYLDQAGSGVALTNNYAIYVNSGVSYFSGNIQNAALTASRAVATDASQNLVSSATTATELGYLSGVTSAIQTQINGKQSSLTFSTGLTNTSGTITVNSSQSISTLSNLTTNGFIKTTGGTGALLIDTNTYLTGNQTITLSGDVSGSGTTAITTAIGSGKVTNAMLAGSIDMSTKMANTMQAAQFPALTGDVTTTAGSLSTTLAATSNGTLATLSKSSGVAIHGSNTNDSASSGYVGEFISSNPGSSVGFGSSGTYTNITSISLTAGDWDVEGMLGYSAGSTTVATKIIGAISTTSGGVDSTNNGGIAILSASFTANVPQYMALSRRRISISSTTTVYLVGNLSYSTGGGAVCSTDSFICARRVR